VKAEELATSGAGSGSPSTDRRARFQTGGVVTIGIVHAIHDTYTAFLPPLLPVFIAKLMLSKMEAGLLSVFIQGPSILQPFIGHLADRVSLRYFVILAPAVSAVAMSLLGVAPAYGALALLLLIAGISAASLHAVGPVVAGRLSGPNLGRGMGVWMVGGELGRVLGPLVIVSAVQMLTLEGTPWLLTGGLLASLILYLRLRHVPGRPPDEGQPRPWREAIRSMRGLLVPLGGIITVRAFVLSAMTTYLPMYLSEKGASLWFAGAALSVVEAAGVAGALLGGALSDRLGRRWVLTASMLSTPLFMVAFLFVGGWLQVPCLILAGFSGLAVTPVIMALVQESFPQNRALANGVYMATSFGLRSVVIVLLGAMGDVIGLHTAFLISALLALAGVPLIRMLPRRRVAPAS